MIAGNPVTFYAAFQQFVNYIDAIPGDHGPDNANGFVKDLHMKFTLILYALRM